MTASAPERDGSRVGRLVDRMLFEEYDRLAVGLPAYRIVLSLLLLLFWSYNIEWVSRLPDSFLDPRPGPFLLMHTVPPVEVLRSIEIARVLAIGALLVGWRTPIASVLTSVLTMTLYGVAYSFGKVDHTILLAITPLLLAPSGWGRRWSVDAVRGRRPPARGWSVALLAVGFGSAYARAGIAKLLGGWWQWDTQAAQGYALRLVRTKGDVLLGGLVEGIDAPVLWELADIATLGLEIGILVLALRLGWFRIGLVGLVGLHIAVFLTMGIDFGKTTYVYAAFLPWHRVTQRVDAVAGQLATQARATTLRAVLAVGALPVAVALWAARTNTPPLGFVLRATVPGAEPWVTKWPLITASAIAVVAGVRVLRRDR